MQQRKKIYKRALEALPYSRYICIAIKGQMLADFRSSSLIVKDFPEFMLFKPRNKMRHQIWFRDQLEREICLDFCILFCNEKMFEDA
jgi:hypothetical protein